MIIIIDLLCFLALQVAQVKGQGKGVNGFPAIDNGQPDIEEASPLNQGFEPILNVISNKLISSLCIQNYHDSKVFQPWSFMSIAELANKANLAIPLSRELGRIFEGQLSHLHMQAPDILSCLGLVPSNAVISQRQFHELVRFMEAMLFKSKIIVDSQREKRELRARIVKAVGPSYKKPAKPRTAKSIYAEFEKEYDKASLENAKMIFQHKSAYKGASRVKALRKDVKSSSASSSKKKGISQILHEKDVQREALECLKIGRALGKSSTLWSEYFDGMAHTPAREEKFYETMKDELCSHSASALAQSKNVWKRWSSWCLDNDVDCTSPAGGEVYLFLEESMSRGVTVAMSELTRLVFLKNYVGFKLPETIPFLSRIRYEGRMRLEKTSISPKEIIALEEIACNEDDYGLACAAGGILLGIWSSTRACHLQRSKLVLEKSVLTGAARYLAFEAYQGKRSGKHPFKYFTTLVSLSGREWWKIITKHLHSRGKDHDFIFENDTSFKNKEPTPLPSVCISGLIRKVLATKLGMTSEIKERTGHSMRRCLINIAYYIGICEADIKAMGLWSDPLDTNSEHRSLPCRYADKRLIRGNNQRFHIGCKLQEFGKKFDGFQNFSEVSFCQFLGTKFPDYRPCLTEDWACDLEDEEIASTDVNHFLIVFEFIKN